MLNQLHLLDFTGALFAFIATCFFVRANTLAWPISLLAILIDVTLYWYRGIYGDAALQLVYLFMVSYGWWQWLYGGKHHSTLPITKIKPQLATILGCATVVAIISLSLFLKVRTNSTIPYWDASTTVLSLVAQYLTCRKMIENWLVWLVVDMLYAGLYFYKHIPAHAMLQLIYLGMAVAGYINWRNQLLKQKMKSLWNSTTQNQD
jgi:nicotinamide mononucleotide transporter